RRDHALRRGRARDPRGARTPRHVALPDRRPARRDERGGGPSDPGRGRPREHPSRGDDARRRSTCGGARGMTDVWNGRAEAYRERATHASGDDLGLVVAWCEPAVGVNVLDVATGGGHVARRLREAGAKVVTVDAAPGMDPDVIAPADHLPFADASSGAVPCPIPPPPFPHLPPP